MAAQSYLLAARRFYQCGGSLLSFVAVSKGKVWYRDGSDQIITTNTAMKRKILERYLFHIAKKIRDWLLFDRKKGILGWLFICLSWIASLLSVQPSYLPLKYPELLQNVFFVVTVLSMLVAVYFIRAAERSRDESSI